MSVDAEMSVLGCMMLDEEFAKTAIDALTPEMFTHSKTQKIFEAATKQYWDGKPIDGVTLIEILPEERDALLKLADRVPTTRHAPEYLRIVRDEWRQKSIQSAIAEVVFDAQNKTAEETVEILRNLVEEQDAITRAQNDTGLITLSEAIKEFKGWLHSQKQETARTGFGGLDRAMGGLVPGSVTIISARSGGGKTDLALNVALRMAQKGNKVLYCTMEMPTTQLLQRAASQLARIEGERVRDRNLSEEEKNDIDMLMDVLEKKARIWWQDEPEISVARVRNKMELCKPDVVFIDHIGLMKRPEYKDSYRSLGKVSNALKQLALEKKIPIIEIVQMNRSVEGRANKRPVLSDLRETGDLEQDADYVLFLWPDEEPQEQMHGNAWRDMNVSLAKNRHGRTGDFKFHWQPQFHTFTEVETKYGNG